MIAITGSTGFLGSHLLLHLLKLGKNIIAIKRPQSSYDYAKKVFELHNSLHLFYKIKWVDCNLFNYSEVVEILNGVDVVFHTAAQVNFNNNKKEIINNNVTITKNIINASILQGVKRFGYVSSIATITNTINGIGIENSSFEILSTQNPYTLSKCLAELEVWRGIHEGLPAVIINPSVILGYNRQWYIFESLIKLLKKGYLYYPPGKSSFVDIKDVVNIIAHLTLHTSITNQRFIVTSENLSYKELFNYICEYLEISNHLKEIGKNKLILLGHLGLVFSSFTKKRFFDTYTARLLTKDFSFSNKKICDTLNYKFIPIKESIRNMLEIYKKLNTN